jgi:hypothetical protein
MAFYSTAQTNEFNNVDLEIRGESVETVRGGETFFYKFTVINHSAGTAENVLLSQKFNGDNNGLPSLEFVSASISQGEFETNKVSKYKPLNYLFCRFGDIKSYASVSITVEVKLPEWGDASKPESSDNLEKTSFEIMKKVFTQSAISSQSLSEEEKEAIKRYQEEAEKERLELEKERKEGIRRLTIHGAYLVACGRCTEKSQKRSANIIVKAFPSKNIPPRIELISPKQDIEIIKPLNKQVEVLVSVKAFDIDGKITKVVIGGDYDQNTLPQTVLENGQNMFLLGGKKYTAQEWGNLYQTMMLDLYAKMKEDPDYEDKLIEAEEANQKTMTLTGKDTYTFKVKNLHYGENQIHIGAYDNGNQVNGVMLKFTVKRDATIKLISPKNNQVITPNSDIVIETESEIKDSDSEILKLYSHCFGGEYFDSSNPSNLPILQKISKVGDIYKHRYIWKPKSEGRFDLRVDAYGSFLTPMLMSNSISVHIAEQRVIKIIGIKNGQEFEKDSPVSFSIQALDIKGSIPRDEYRILIDGQDDGSIQNSWQREETEPYKRIVVDEMKVHSMRYLSSGTHTLQVIAKPYNSSDVPIIGKSEIITFKVREPK